jgi:cytochrome c biogenesis protein CcmG/thiol:disulfide interchange protein DsbE
MSIRLFPAVGAIILLLAAVLLVWQAGLPENNRILGRVQPFNADTLAGESLVVDDTLNQPVVLNFWATWCKPCLAEMPRLDEAYRDGDNEWLLIGVNTSEDPNRVQEWVEQNPVSFPIIIDSTGQIAVSYGAQTQLPTTVFIDRQGYIRKIVYGAISESALADGLDTIGIKQ